jgi:hypothetical protein
MSGIFNEEINGYNKISKTINQNYFISKQSENGLFEIENNINNKNISIEKYTPYSPNKNKIIYNNNNNNNFLGNSNFNFLNIKTNENTQKKKANKNENEEEEDINYTNEATKYSHNSIFSKKMQIQQSENNEILYSGFFGKKTDASKFNGNFKTDDSQKQVNPFENLFDDNHKKNNLYHSNLNFGSFLNENNFFIKSSGKFNENNTHIDPENLNNSNNFNFKHYEIPENIFANKSIEIDNNNNKKDFNTLVKSVKISSSFNDTYINTNTNTYNKSIFKSFNNNESNFGTNSSLSKKKSK